MMVTIIDAQHEKGKLMIYNALALYIEINLISIIVLLIILMKCVRTDLIPRWDYFVLCIALMIANIGCDTVWQMMDSGVIPAMRWVDYLIKSGYFLTLTVIGFMWFLYFESAHQTAFSAWRTSIFLSAIFVYAHVILIIINTQTGWLFTVEQNLHYIRGPLFILQYVFPFTYLVVTMIRSFITLSQDSNYVERGSFFINVICPLIPIISSLMQLYFRRIPFLAPALMFSILLIYTYLLESAVRFDPLTGLVNRRVLFRTISRWMKSPSYIGLYLFMIDVDFFKKINDNYGHVAGDNALVNVAEILNAAIEECGSHAIAARYGGDEFNIVLDSSFPMESNEVRDKLNNMITDLNNSGKNPYKLSLSIGCVKYYPSKHHSVRDLVNAADSALYEVKQKRHTVRV